ncbi:MAG: glycosyltransferase family 2 protein [Rubrivivax sp.]|nr:glycosyltransferase family 2 protein [Rubrivivax sp.]
MFNGEAFIGQALESLLGQTFGDFELLVADNASTDGTAAVVEAIAARDSRVRLIRHTENIGAPRNWNCLVDRARGVYFKWASASDICTKDALASHVQVLDTEPDVVLCYGRTRLVDGNGRALHVYEGDRDFSMAMPSERFERVCLDMQLNNPMSGLVRTAVLRRTGLDRLYPGGDMVLTAELALYGCIRLLPEVSLVRRQSADTFTSMRTPLEIQRMYDPGAQRPLRTLHWRLHADRMLSVWRAPIPLAQKWRACGVAARLMRHDRRRLWAEVRSLIGHRAAA